MAQISEIQPQPASKYQGSTLEKVLHAICEANATLTKTSSSLLERLHVALENMRKSNARQQSLMMREATSALLFGIAEGAATMGSSAVTMVTPNAAGAVVPTSVFGRVMYNLKKPATLELIKANSESAVPVLRGMGKGSEAYTGSKKSDLDFRHNLENRSLNNAQEVNGTVERQRDSLITSANAILNAKSRSSQ